MIEEPQGDSESRPEGPVCRWCHGSGSEHRSLLYVPGANPFQGPGETISRPGRCKHCRGTGVYDSALDPTLDQARNDPPYPM